MNEWTRLLLAVPAGYLLGGIPFPYLLGRLRGKDLFRVGTDNPGAANLFRAVSRPLGLLAALLDIGKGTAAILVARRLGVPSALLVLPGAGAMFGHWYSPFLGFRGGEALATVVGVGLGLTPVPAIAGILVGLILLAIIRSTGHAAGLAWPVFVGVAIWRGVPWAVVVGATILATLVTVRSAVRRSRTRLDAP